MLFNSYGFVLAFLPITLALFWAALLWAGRRPAVVIILAASLFFYGWWDVRYLALLIASTVVNYALGGLIARERSRWLLAAGVAGNLAVLIWFKYAGFLAGIAAALAGQEYRILDVILPLGISFFVFQKIAYLVDCWREGNPARSFLDFAAFVMFFPQLIAGPIVRHGEMLPQLADLAAPKPRALMVATGAALFAFALAKKVFVADFFGDMARPIFAAAEHGAALGLIEAWSGALAYSFQIYFDFSAYSEMALGLALMFGLNLPANFDSPYKSRSLIEFWRRWHMSLSRFLKDYLYIPLGGGRRGPIRRAVNLMVVMGLGGLWHGANWTFLAWGALHGLGLLTNHLWRALWGEPARPNPLMGSLGWLATFVLVVAAWVLFRAETFAGAATIWRGMFADGGIVLPVEYGRYLAVLGANEGFVRFADAPYYTGRNMALPLLAALIWVTAMPNLLDVFGGVRVALNGGKRDHRWLSFGVSARWGAAAAAALGLGILGLGAPAEFLYFQF